MHTGDREKSAHLTSRADLLSLKPMIGLFDAVADSIVGLGLVDLNLAQRLELLFEVVVLKARADLAYGWYSSFSGS